ncbi:MAG TPA: CdaR family protein [Thermoanaerobaculaceae bacterium]|nr:CdaR family protein [Thermoanaerobaculaceae bacterium]HRS15495.1 CdaR family protein [Thermoanaerobaculaceae bacterium]
MRPLPRKLASLGVAFVLACLVWYANALERRERISEREIETSLTLVNVPSEMVVTSEVPRSMTLRVRGPLKLLRSLSAAEVGVVLDLRGAREGENDLPVEARNVQVPALVEVLAVSPAQVPLWLERLVQRRIPVRPRLAGLPAEGLEIQEVVVEPAVALVSGPRAQLERIPGLTTDPLDVDGASGPVEALVAVRSPHPLVRVIDPLAVRVVARVGPAANRPHQGGR